MSDKLQQKLDQETVSPIFAVFLRILLIMAGLLEDFGDSELEIEEIKANPEDMKSPGLDSMMAMDRAVGTDLSTAVRDAMTTGEAARATLGEHFFDDMLRQRRAHLEQMVAEREASNRCHGDWSVGNVSDCERIPMPTVSAYNPRRPNDLRRFEELPIHEQADEIHIDLGALGTVAIPVPEGAQSLEVDPRSFTIQWTMQDGSVRPQHDLRDYMTSLPRRQVGGFFNYQHADGYCTPSRRPMTGRDRYGRDRSFRDIGHFSFSDGSPVSYGIDHNGRAVMIGEDGPTPESRHVGPTVVGRHMDGRLVLMDHNGTPYAEGERGEGPCLDQAG